MGEVHELLQQHGKLETRHRLEGRRGSRIVEAASNWLSDEDQGIGYIYSGWCQTALPHKRPADDSQPWRHDTDRITLVIHPAIRAFPGEKTEYLGVPYGAIARLILIYLQSEALRTSSRDVELGGSLRAFLRRLEIPVGGKTARLLREQAARISRCTMSFQGQFQGKSLLVNQTIVDRAILMESEQDNLQGSLFMEYARLSEGFFNQLRQHAVPLDEAAIRHIRNSSMALDVYCWLAYRLQSLKADRSVSWTALATQFGGGFKQRKHFKSAFTESLRLALAVYAQAKVEETPTGLLLKPSPPPVRKLIKA